MIVRPSFLGPYRSGHPFEVFSVVARVYFRIEVVDTRIERKLFIRQFYPFPHIKQLALHVGFETGFEIVPSLFPFYVDQSAGEVAVFYRRDSPHDFYFGDVVGGDGTHVYPFAGRITSRFPTVGDILHIGIVVEGDTVDNERSPERGHVVVARPCPTGFA